MADGKPTIKAKPKPSTMPARVVDPDDRLRDCMVFAGISPETKQAQATARKSRHRSKRRKT